MIVNARGLGRKTIFGAFILAIALSASAQEAPSAGDVPLKTGEAVLLATQAPPARAPAEVGPEYIRAVIMPMNTPDAPIRVRFDKAIHLERLKAAPSSLILSIRSSGQALAGSWRWEDMNELRFYPAAGKVKTGQYVEVSVSGRLPLRDGGDMPVSSSLSFNVENFQMGSKAASQPVEAGKPRFISFLDSGLRKIGGGPLYFLYDQPVEPEALSRYFSATCVGSDLKLQVRRPLAVSIDRDGVYKTSHLIALTFSELPPDGAVVKVKYPAFANGTDVETADEDFAVFTDFRWDSRDLRTLRSGAAARLSSSWFVGFNSPVDPAILSEALSISPRPPVFDLSFEYGGDGVYIRAEFDIGKLYSIKIDPGFTDLLGNKLKEPLSFAFKSQDLPPVLELPAFTLLLETGTNRLPAKYRNLKDFVVSTYRYDDPADFVRALEAGKGAPIGAPSSTIKVAPLENAMNSLYQADFGIGHEAGLKYVEITATGRGSESPGPLTRGVLLQTSNLGISAKVSDGAVFAWVTRLSDAAPVAGAQLVLRDAGGKEIGSGTTAADGTANIKTPLASGSELEGRLYLSASLGKDVSVCRLANNELSGAWQFNLPGAVKGAMPLAAALFTERGAYRPGETVRFKAFVRDLPEYDGEGSATLVIHDPRGQEAFTGNASLDAYRGADWRFDVAAGAPVGEYSALLSLGDYSCSRTFRVEEYRVPTFQVAVASEDSAWIIDRQVRVKAKATYLKGGKLSGREIEWRVYRQPETFAPSGFPGYVFTLERDLAAAGTVSDERGSLDANGEALLSFIPSHPDSNGPMLYIAQAAVTDADRQNYAGRFSRVVHATGLYVGVKPPPRSIFRSDDKLSFPIVVTDTEGKVLAGRNVRVFLDAMSYDQNTMLDEGGMATTYNREVIDTRDLGTIDSGAAPVDFSLSTGRAGYYRVRLECRDQGGRTASTAFAFTASGGESVAWPRFDRERIELVLDKKSYKAGDTATVVVQSPFASARGLVTVEANGVLDRYPFAIDKNTPSVKIPVKASYAPNAYVSAILVRGRSHFAKDATGFETGAPAYRIGYARLEVDPSAQRLSVALAEKSLTTSPGKQVKLSFAVADSAGKPSDASATVMVVDEAVLGLTNYATPDPIAMAYAFRVLTVRNASNILDLPHSRRARFETLFPGGDSDASATLSASDDVLRKLFKSTAFYDAAVKVGSDGKASVSFKLPDNLTTYRIMIVAANSKGQMGSGQGALLTRKGLSVEPVIPRFVYEGDSLTVEARVFNSTDADGTATVTAAFAGLDPVDTLSAAKVQVKKEASASIAYRVRVPADGGKASVRFSVAMGSSSDSVEYSLPVRTRGDKQTTVANAIVSGSGSIDLALPAKRSPGTVEVVLSQTPLSELKDSVQYLMEYPNGCIEQTTSTAYPLVVLKDLLPAIGVQVSAADLKAFSEAGVARILSFQTKDGGLSYWPGGKEPHAFATAFGLTALIEAKKRGYAVSDEALRGMGDYLEYALKSGKITGEMPHAAIADGDTRALFVMTLGRLGRPQSAYISALWGAKDKLTPFGLAFLAIAVKESKGDQSLLEPILAELRKAATESRDEAYFEGSKKGGWSLDSPLRSDAASLVAFAASNKDPAAAQRFLKGLMNRRQGGLWGNTQENVFGIMGVYQLVSGSSSGPGADPAAAAGWSVAIGARKFPASAFEKNSMGVLRLSVPESSLGGASDKLRVQVEGPAGQSCYATVRAEYSMPVDAALLSPKSVGFEYERRYESMDGSSLEGKTIPLGSLVRVRLMVRNGADRHYVAVDDMLPAGLEPQNASLATTAATDMGAISDAALKTQAVISYSEMRDHRVAFYADELVAGDYEFTYLARATTPGVFHRPAGRAEAMYAPEEFGTSGGGSVTVK